MIRPPLLKPQWMNGLTERAARRTRPGAHELKEKICLSDFKDDVSAAGGRSKSQCVAPDRSDFLHRTLRAPIGFSHPEDDRIDESESVIEHQALDFAICRPTPVLAYEESPTDFDFAALGIISMKPARTNDRARCTFDECEPALRCYCTIKIFSENRFREPVTNRMKLPDQWIRSGCKHFMPIIGPKRSDEYRVADKRWLKVRWGITLCGGIAPP